MYVPRLIEPLFRKLEPVYAIIAVVGPRQAGKTTFLRELAKARTVAYLLFDDPDVRTLFEQDVKKFERQYVETPEAAILDEVQQGTEAGQKLKYLAERGRKLWITSSSEAILGKDVLSHLVGRVSIIRLYPFSLSEFLRAKNVVETTPIQQQRLMWEHAIYGGYPKVVLTEELELKRRILRDLWETMILKDVAQTFSIDDSQALEQLSRVLAANSGQLLSYDLLAKTLNISFPTLKKYLQALEKSYFFMRIPPFCRNKNKEISKQPKAYFIDTGLRQVVLNFFPTEVDGHTFENYVFSELLKAGFSPKYWRTKAQAEVDFIIELEGEVIPIEVKLTPALERSLRSFIEQYQPRRAYVVNYQGIAGTTKLKNCTIHTTGVRELLVQLRGAQDFPKV